MTFNSRVEHTCPTCGWRIVFDVWEDLSTDSLRVMVAHDQPDSEARYEQAYVTRELAVWSAGSLEECIADLYLQLAQRVFQVTRCMEWEEPESETESGGRLGPLDDRDRLPTLVSQDETVFRARLFMD